MIKHRTFKDSDAEEVANLVKETMLTTNIKDYSKEYLDNDFVNKIIAVGSIGAY